MHEHRGSILVIARGLQHFRGLRVRLYVDRRKDIFEYHEAILLVIHEPLALDGITIIDSFVEDTVRASVSFDELALRAIEDLSIDVILCEVVPPVSRDGHREGVDVEVYEVHLEAQEPLARVGAHPSELLTLVSVHICLKIYLLGYFRQIIDI